jgi:two-component system, chemotaxis family, response regulator Rcp1
MNDPQGEPVEILLIEDNPGDVKLTQHALKSAKVMNRMNVVEDGEAAVEYLTRRGRYAGAVRPDLILLDLNLPKLSGREVLARIKTDDDLKTIPVVILTTSDNDHDVIESYKNYANCYVTKPIDLAQFGKVVRTIEDFWLTIVRLPRKG